MTSANAKAFPVPAEVDTPWYELISDAPEPPEDAMQQATTIHDVMSVLRARYENDPTVLWSNQTNIIYDSNVPGSVVAPDGYIVFGVDAKRIEDERRSYRIDEWGVVPAFVLEVASESTAPNDLGRKREIYARMGADEYWRLDRTGEYYGEFLVGERLVDGRYQRYELHEEPNGDLWSRSEVLGVDFYFRVEEDGVRHFLLRDASTGEWLNTLGLERAARLNAEIRSEAAEARSEAAEARNRELEAELERLRQQQ